MKYSIGDKILTKKPHACGNNEWEVVRIGADVKLKCIFCGHSIFLSAEQVAKITKQLIVSGSEIND